MSFLSLCFVDKKLQYSIFQNRGNKLDMASDEEDSIYLLCLLGFGTWKLLIETRFNITLTAVVPKRNDD